MKTLSEEVLDFSEKYEDVENHLELKGWKPTTIKPMTPITWKHPNHPGHEFITSFSHTYHRKDGKEKAALSHRKAMDYIKQFHKEMDK